MKPTHPPKLPKPVIGITLGDPEGVGPEIILKALARKNLYRVCRPWVIGDMDILQTAASTIGTSPEILAVSNPEALAPSPSRVCVLPIAAPAHTLVVEILRCAASRALDNQVQAIVTAPVHKHRLVQGDRRWPGHTEFFADWAGVKEVGMMLVGGPLRVMLVTTHVGMKAMVNQITTARICTTIRLAHESLIRDFAIHRPRIAVAALNPHAGDGGLFGEEERRIILPAVESARSQGMDVTPPLPADTAFRKASRGEFDVVVAMYHDQALIPVKLLAFGKAVNLTVGLPFIRTSVDHGTADDLVGTGMADPGSLHAAIRLAVRLDRTRQTGTQNP